MQHDIGYTFHFVPGNPIRWVYLTNIGNVKFWTLGSKPSSALYSWPVDEETRPSDLIDALIAPGMVQYFEIIMNDQEFNVFEQPAQDAINYIYLALQAARERAWIAQAGGGAVDLITHDECTGYREYTRYACVHDLVEDERPGADEGPDNGVLMYYEQDDAWYHVDVGLCGNPLTDHLTCDQPAPQLHLVNDWPDVDQPLLRKGEYGLEPAYLWVGVNRHYGAMNMLGTSLAIERGYMWRWRLREDVRHGELVIALNDLAMITALERMLNNLNKFYRGRAECYQLTTEASAARIEVQSLLEHHGIAKETMVANKPHGNTGRKNASKGHDAHLHCGCKATDKNAWVAAAQAEGLKLGAWVIRELNKASATGGDQ